MARLQLNKSSLSREMEQLRTYERFLPSLDLKRKQLMGEKAKAVIVIARMETRVAELTAQVGRDLPMLGNASIDLEGLVRLTDYQLGVENVASTPLPVLQKIEVATRPYSPMTKPHWVDDVARLLREMLEARLQARVAQQRLDLLSEALDTVTQRVNLFDKVLIPTARTNIKKIRIYLSDADMQAVVRSKISKRKRAVA
ncbi:MAG: V-type ATP synthase subunit D [Pseudomonadota bacterium]